MNYVAHGLSRSDGEYFRFAAIGGNWEPVTNGRDFSVACATSDSCCNELILQKTTNYVWAQGSYIKTGQTNHGYPVYKHKTEDVYLYMQVCKVRRLTWNDLVLVWKLAYVDRSG